MFGVDWSNPQTLWLNLTNLALGVVTLLAFGVLVYGVAYELLAHRHKAREPRLFAVPGLGLTMADGGEPLKKPARREPERVARPRE